MPPEVATLQADLRGKTAIVTGAAHGFGRAICLALATSGARVWALDILADEVEQTALVSLTRQLGHELGEWGITVNCIAPGFVRSNPNTERQWEAMGEQGQNRLLANIALKRLGTPQDIAYGVLFFASGQAGWISGQTIAVDGGK